MTRGAPAARSGDQALAEGPVLLWEAAGEPVAMVGRRRPVSGVPRVGPVHPPAEHRRHGYAAAATAAVWARLMAAGARCVVLFADVANPTSTGGYRRPGFRPVGDQADWVLEY
jgi:predicted GNAT family acetyltransferase